MQGTSKLADLYVYGLFRRRWASSGDVVAALRGTSRQKRPDSASAALVRATTTIRRKLQTVGRATDGDISDEVADSGGKAWATHRTRLREPRNCTLLPPFQAGNIIYRAFLSLFDDFLSRPAFFYFLIACFFES